MAIVANAEQLEAVGTDIVNLIEEIKENTDKIGTHINGNNSNWTDQNGPTFSDKYEELRNEIPGYLAQGMAFAGFLKGAANYVREARNLSSKAVNSTDVAA